MDAILDTSVIIEIFKGNKRILHELKKDKTVVYGISVITLFELYCGNLKEREELFLEKIPKLSFDEKSAKFAGKIYRDLKTKGKTPKVKDLLIASSAIAHSKTLYTCDSDFEMFKEYGLKLKILTLK
jgi:predicted nucleic acid-binding protein